MYWQFADNRQRFSPSIIPQQQSYYDIPMVHGRQDMTSFALPDDDSGEVKRPMNSFLLWAKVMRKKYAKENPTMHNAEISKLLGKVWNGMTTNDKRPYVERAEKLRVLHMRDHPNYRYAPRKKKDRKQAQRMISPEIAAAFHNAIFDLKTVAGERQHKEEGGSNPSCEYIMLTGRRDETQTMLYENTKSQAQFENFNPKLMANSSNNSGSTFHYYAPENKANFKLEPGSEIREERRANYEKLERKHRHDSQISPMSYDRQTSACSGQSLPTCDTPKSWCDASSNGDSDASSMMPSSPESTAESLDQEVLPFLRALLDFPLHVDSRRVGFVDQGVPDDRSYILNDFGDIVGKEGDTIDQRKSCMFL